MLERIIELCLNVIDKSQKNEDKLTETMTYLFQDFHGVSRQHIRDVMHNVNVISSMFDDKEKVKDLVEYYLYDLPHQKKKEITYGGEKYDVSNHKKFAQFLLINFILADADEIY